ncbi:peptidoglycan DD-metalloendopeptidase family protein [Gordonia alkanivorans]|uniref:peptidoglycan DD-metalloendopeptidase family protein n=1 Tax=Gordonia alkanivorans TaxID=84096 RepID=UPI0024B6C3CF|nr:peptidoglycan DD-metalloendopeptidase family protein [Gordonia alkanivorans]MDJ0010089.1 peptidoglycan DD-metalloendopeptidase family protein [Gordonia alkanivorans]MDJ0495721.1 peptidoglycan DD-metalloendopeptidase family protein [Gordonia alkanivorans]
MRLYPLRKGAYTVSSPFGAREGGFHYGLDFAAKDGTPFYACQSGTVQYIGKADGYGEWIVVDSDDSEGGGCVEYGHMWDAFATGLKVGSKVKAGQHIGYVGSNGGSTGPHLHITVWERGYGGKRIDPAGWLRGAGHLGEPEAPTATPSKGTIMAVPNPVTRTQISPNRHSGGRDVDWIVIHTQEGSGTARSITDYLCRPAAQVSYNAVCDDRETVLVVPWDQNPWSAMNANNRGDHILMAGSFASWSRNRWLSPDVSDGKNEDLQLTRTAALVAWRCAVRNIPIRYVGGKGMPKTPGVCGHVDFGQWGGGHTDPGPNFPWDELIRRAISIYNGGKDWLAMATMAEVEALIYKCLKTYVGPIGSDVKDIRQQITGGRDSGQYPGFEQGGSRTLYDLTAAVAEKQGVPNTRDTLEEK